MAITTALSNEQVIETAVEEIAAAITDSELKVVLYFASSVYDPEKLAALMEQSFPGADVFGCTTAGELISGKMTKGSIVAMGLGADVVGDIDIQVVENVHLQDEITQAFKNFEEYYKVASLEMDPEKYAGIILVDGLSRAEEKVMDAVGNLTNVTFVGGSAGDDLKFEKTHVFAKGKAYSDAAVLALFKPVGEFDFIKTQSFCATEHKLLATDVDEEKRIVFAFDDKPAAAAYAAAVNCQEQELTTHFMEQPLGLMIDGEPYVRSPQRTEKDAVVFYCNVKKGMEMAVLSSTDMLADTEKALKEKNRKEKPIRALVNFHCILRTLQLEKQGKTAEYGKVFSEIPTVGFSTYGEAYIGHINQTSTMLVLY